MRIATAGLSQVRLDEDKPVYDQSDIQVDVDLADEGLMPPVRAEQRAPA